jgi:signal transduction histidine kinase
VPIPKNPPGKEGWTRRYQSALRKHLDREPGSPDTTGQALGRQAVALGLETLDLAKAHAKALAALIAPHTPARTRSSQVKRAGEFFAEAAIRIEKTHRAAIETDALIRQLNRSLSQRTRESSTSRQRLTDSIRLRKEAEADLEKSGKNHSRVLAESHRLLKNLRVLTHSCLAAQEEGRRRVSRQLQDEIGQGLLGIHVQLLTLKKALKASTISLRKEIGSAQRVASKSTRKIIRSIHRSPRES